MKNYHHTPQIILGIKQRKNQQNNKVNINVFILSLNSQTHFLCGLGITEFKKCL